MRRWTNPRPPVLPFREAVLAKGKMRPTCRVCGGSRQLASPLLAGVMDPCPWCDEAGRARAVCETCGEALPLCPCFGALRAQEEPPALELPRRHARGRK